MHIAMPLHLHRGTELAAYSNKLPYLNAVCAMDVHARYSILLLLIQVTKATNKKRH